MASGRQHRRGAFNLGGEFPTGHAAHRGWNVSNSRAATLAQVAWVLRRSDSEINWSEHSRKLDRTYFEEDTFDSCYRLIEVSKKPWYNVILEKFESQRKKKVRASAELDLEFDMAADDIEAERETPGNDQ